MQIESPFTMLARIVFTIDVIAFMMVAACLVILL